MSDNDSIRRGNVINELKHTAFFEERDQKTAIECVKSIPAGPHEMTAREFVKAYSRMCHTTGQCYKCPVFIEADKEKPVKSCWFWVRDNCEKAVPIVEQWAKEHPEKKRKTYAEDFKEKFNKACEVHGHPVGCREGIYHGNGCPHKFVSCEVCWNEEMEEDEDDR